MSAFKLFFLIFVCAVGLCSTAAAQQGVARPIKGGAQPESLDSDFGRGRRAMEAQARGSRRPLYVRRVPRENPLTKAERARIKAILAPDAEDAAKYKDFLKQNNAGLFRLFPDFDCETKNTVRADGDCATLISGSWNYSFRKENYSNIDFLDIQFKNGNLISKGFLSQGILARLGDVALETVSLASGGVKFLLEFAPANQIADAKKQFVQISKGIDAPGGYRYANSLRAEENTTYVLRAVAYRSKVENPGFARFISPLALKLTYLNEIDKRVDLTLAFRIVRRNQNGSITILWKELNRQEAPKLIFAKNEKLYDIKP